MTMKLPAEWEVDSVLMIDPETAASIGLPPEHHGVILIEFGDGTRWSLATTALEPFADYLASEHPALATHVLHEAGAIWRLAYGWPDRGFRPHTDLERD